MFVIYKMTTCVLMIQVNIYTKKDRFNMYTNNTKRSGYVRTTSTDVYKGVEASYSKRIEYEDAPNWSGRILLIGLMLAGIVVFLVTHPAILINMVR
jgi:hypothetical protein